MSSLLVDEITHSGNTGTSNLVLAGTGNVTVSSDLIATKQNGCERIVLEQYYGPCDGEDITLQDGTHTIAAVTGAVNGTTSFVDLGGSNITYTPPTGTTLVIYEYNFSVCYQATQSNFCNTQVSIGGTAIGYGEINVGVGQFADHRVHIKVGIPIGGTANANTGRQATWTSGKELKVQAKEPNASHHCQFHGTSHFSNATNSWAMPYVGITAIG